MDRQNWDDLSARFYAAHAENGIGLEEWCHREGVVYGTARRYIKPRKTAQKYEQKTAQKKVRKTAQIEPKKTAKKPASNKPIKRPETTPVTSDTPANVLENFGINEQQALFARLIVEGKTRIEAYAKAEYQGEGNAAYVNASRMLRNAKVSRYVNYLRNERQQRYSAELDEVITQLIAIIRADPNEIAQYRRVNCRFCWGENHHYQWRDLNEQLQAEKKAELDKRPPPDLSGGVGFIDNMDPNPDCPRCNGEGKGEAHFADTRDVVGDARYLLQGVKLTKFGIEIDTADKSAARRELARLLVVRGADDRQVELNIKRLELQNEKLEAEIEDIRRNAPPPLDDEFDGFEIEFIKGPEHGEDADPVE
ncbi:TPA: terminase small subunit [Citrobacter werkmanii]